MQRKNDNVMDAQPLTVLLVEDDDIHAHLVQRSLENNSMVGKIFRVSNDCDALSFIQQRGSYPSAPRTDMVLLDLNLPKASGHEVLAAIKQNRYLQIIPVVIMTTSRDEGDRAKAYLHHANSYIVKPADFQEFRQVIRDISHYWGTCNERPCTLDAS